MPWARFFMQLDGPERERIEQCLFDAGALSVTLEGAGGDQVLEPLPGTAPMWPDTQLSALFPPDTTLDTLRDRLAVVLGTADLPPHGMEILEDRVWEREWLEHFKPMRFGERLWVVPSGLEMPEHDPGAVILCLDPGLAFGTGTHATTALCLEWLDQTPQQGLRVLDYGCGSGILAIAALRLGAAEATAVDIDAQAITATRDNAAANGVGSRLRVCHPDDLDDLKYDILIANILAGPLLELMARFAELLKPGGRIVLSGLLGAQADEVAAGYQELFRLDAPVYREDWARLSGRRRQVE